MNTALCSRGMIALLLVAVIQSTLSAEGATYQPDQHIMVRSGVKGERRCVIVSVNKRADGSIEYRVKAVDNGEMLTIVDRGNRGIARSNTVRDDAPKTSVSSDPLLTSSLRIPAAGGANENRSELVHSEYITTAVMDARRAKLARESASKQPQLASNGETGTGRATVGDVSSDPMPSQMIRMNPMSSPSMVPQIDPSLVRQVRYSREAGLAASDPIPMGFAIPAAAQRNTQQTVLRSTEVEERMAVLSETLKNALQPSARLRAVEQMTETPGADAKLIRSLLMTSASEDPAAIVRATSLRYLGKMGVRDAQFQTLLNNAKQDPDVRVRSEAEQIEGQ